MISTIADLLGIFEAIKSCIYKIFEFVYELWLKRIKKEDFYYKDYTKHVTVYNDGHSIIIDSSIVKILIPENVKEITRKITLSNTKSNIIFENFSDMKHKSRQKRFKEMGFWYIADSHQNISLIQDVKGTVNESKDVLDLNFIVDNRAYTKDKVATFTYAFSIPGMYPIKDGYKDKKNIARNDFEYTSSSCVHKRIKKFNFILSFENGIHIEGNPKFRIYDNVVDCDRNGKLIKRDIKCFDFVDDIFYDKYSITINRPKKESLFEAYWNIKEYKPEDE